MTQYYCFWDLTFNYIYGVMGMQLESRTQSAARLGTASMDVLATVGHNPWQKGAEPRRRNARDNGVLGTMCLACLF